MFERLLAFRNDVGLLAEEYDPRTRRQMGNFPQAFSHVASRAMKRLRQRMISILPLPSALRFLT
jgi:GH15 family glucan-1,4-alpha-glucosidase